MGYIMNVETRPNCQDLAVDPDIFFAPIGESEFHDPGYRKLWQSQTAEALEVCSTCPVIQQCLNFSYENIYSMNIGIYGGLTPPERMKLVGVVSNTYITVRMEQLEHFYNPARKIATERGVKLPQLDAPNLGDLSWVEPQKSLQSRLLQSAQV